jgi:hypothetical protein
MNESSIGEQIAALEKRLELKRKQTLAHVHEVRDDVEAGVKKAARWVPLVSAAAALVAAGLLIARRRSGSPSRSSDAGRGVAAALASAVGAAVSLAVSPQGAALARAFDEWRRAR